MIKRVNKYSTIDVFRIIAAIMVVTIHTSPLSDAGATADFVLTRIIARVAVPFFFVTSGFFLISEYAKNTDKLISFLKKTALIYGIAIIIYLPVNIYNGYFNSDMLLSKILRDILFNGTMYHLWYLPAAMLGAFIAWHLVRKLGFTKAFIVTAVLYVVGLLGDSYFGVTVKFEAFRNIYTAIFQVSDYSRNGIFFAPIFFVMGGLLAKRKTTDTSGNDKLMLILFFDLMLIEALLLHRFKLQRHDSMYVFLVPCVYYLFHCLMGAGGTHSKAMSNAALIIYIIHPMVIIAVRLAAKITRLESILIDNSFIHFAAVSIISSAVAYAFVKAFPPKKKEKLPLRAWKEIDTDAVCDNAAALLGATHEGCEMMAIVKADAYGHGAYEISTALEQSGVKAFAVATLDEGIELRKYGIRGDILVLGYTAPEYAKYLKKFRLTQTVVSLEHAEALNSRGYKLNVHIKIDTGMHRLGLNPCDFGDILCCFKLKNITVTGVFSHLCVADSQDSDNVEFTKGQISAFKSVADELKRRGIGNVKLHLQSSFGLLNYPEIECDYIRPGIVLYGAYATIHDIAKTNVELHPCMKLKARVTQVRSIKAGDTVGYGRQFKAEKDTTIATVSIGYADGLPRGYTGNVVINGSQAPIVGRICMDQMFVDISKTPNVKVGDVVVLIGDGITVEMMAENMGTITNDILSRMGKRLETVTVKRN